MPADSTILLDYLRAVSFEHDRSVARLGTFCAEGDDSIRIQASHETLRLLDLDAEHLAGVSTALLRHVRFEQLAQLHRETLLRRRRLVKRRLTVTLRDGTERRLLARVMRDGGTARSFGILLDVTISRCGV